MKNNIILFKTYIIIFISLMTLNIFFLYSSLLSFNNFITYFPFINSLSDNKKADSFFLLYALI